jgi:hypothetical protein
MSRMSNLDAELRAAGIDPEGVDLDEVAAYRLKIKRKIGLLPTRIDAAKALYTGPQIKGWMRIP